MGMRGKARHTGKETAGKAKEAAGRARGDKPLKKKGKRDQKVSQLKKASEHLKAAFKR